MGGSGSSAAPPTGLNGLNFMTSLWNAAYASIANTATRNHNAVLAARVLRFGVRGQPNNPAAVPGGIVTALRRLIRNIQGAGTVLPGDLGDLGLTPHIKQRAVFQIPNAGPELTLDKSPPHTLVVKFHQEGARENSRAKPPGCKAILLKWVTANGRSGSGSFTKSPCSIDVGAALTGQGISISGTWVMGNNKESPPGNTIVGGVP
jgi:hypothetical protein